MGTRKADLLQCFAFALNDEREAVQKETNRRSYQLSDGRRSDASWNGAVYAFGTPGETELPDGLTAELSVGERGYRAEILRHQRGTLLLYVERDAEEGLPPDHLATASLTLAPWFLLEALADRIEELRSNSNLSMPFRLLAEEFETKCASPNREPAGGASSKLLEGLNREQSGAVRSCLSSPLHFVWGPPGTGKTTTLGAFVAELERARETVVVTSHSNVAVDAALLASMRRFEQLGLAGELIDQGAIIRAGSPTLSETRGWKITVQERARALNPQLAQELDQLERELDQLEAGHGADTSSIRARYKALRQQLRAIESDLLRSARIVFCTLSKMAIADELHTRPFDSAIVDEASMVYPPQVALAASRATRRCSVFGDFRQLAPITTSHSPVVRGFLRRDAFELAGLVGDDPADSRLTMLTTQYRMHPEIREAVSRFSYGGRLVDGLGVEQEVAPLASAPPMPDAAFVYLDTSRVGGRGMNTTKFQAWSRINVASAFWSVRIAAELLPTMEQVVVLSPYRPQTRLINALLRATGLPPSVHAATIHRYQGSEQDGVVLDLTEAPPTGVPGRLLSGDDGKRLLNVAVSRARGKLVVLADPALRGAVAAELLDGAAEWTPSRKASPWSRGATTLYSSLAEARTDLVEALGDGEAIAWRGKSPAGALGALRSSEKTKAGPEGQLLVVTADELWCAVEVDGHDQHVWRCRSSMAAGLLSGVLGERSWSGARQGSGSTRAECKERCEEAALKKLAASSPAHVWPRCPSCGYRTTPSLLRCGKCGTFLGRRAERARNAPATSTQQRSSPKVHIGIGTTIFDGDQAGTIVEVRKEGVIVEFASCTQLIRWYERAEVDGHGHVTLRP